MPVVTCPACGEGEQLRGDEDGERIRLTCELCGATWDRDTTPSCRLCGSTDLQGVATSTLQDAGRGEQRAPSGIVLRYYCWTCRSHDVTSREPLQGPQPPPGTGRDVRQLRGR